MRRTFMYVGLMICLCAPLLATAQDPGRANAERASQLASSVERTIKVREPKWSLKSSDSEGSVSLRKWTLGPRNLELKIYVYDSPAEASKMLYAHGVFQVAMSQEMKDFGDEARFVAHEYFSWVGVRRGNMLAEVHGPGKELSLSKRFAQHALEQLQEK